MTMWPRLCELALGVWLIASGWVVQHPDPGLYRLVTVSAGVCIAALELLAITFIKPYAYLLALVVAAGLLAFAFLAAPPEAQGTQNVIVVALLLAMFAILPTEATRPPRSWREFHNER